MSSLQVKDMEINRGRAKVCVPVVATSENEILNEFNELNYAGADLVEFRADYYDFIQDPSKVLCLLERIRKLYDKPLLFTLRTKSEGGVCKLNPEYYFKLNKMVIESKLVDLIDIEFFSQSEKRNDTIILARKNNLITILSSHDFFKTPSREEIIERVTEMMAYGDIAKIAVMPNTEEDVLTLLSASLHLKKEKKRPFIALAMGPLGTISRISCELFGSCITFASYKGKSAPGQLNLNITKEFLKVVR